VSRKAGKGMPPLSGKPGLRLTLFGLSVGDEVEYPASGIFDLTSSTQEVYHVSYYRSF
jgi:hypothetical protein